MAKIIYAKTGQEKSVSDGEKIKTACEELGVLFGCEDGICGTCMINIVSGEKNLSDLTQAEKDLERDLKNRLACQCKIKKGDVKIDF
ncbi:MAG TPA: 2Fe-2S iron-sulfur cluster-binding protein [Candidatus Nanoarchaeia archaeon]|nr:2Fe-2S iron-sulfur cluster-binding protein [Candidatus Nanoarchaeia archaeon]